MGRSSRKGFVASVSPELDAGSAEWFVGPLTGRAGRAARGGRGPWWGGPGGRASAGPAGRQATAGCLSAVLACAPRASRSPQAGSIPAMTVIVPPFRGPRSGSCHPGYQPLPRHGRCPARNLGLGLS